MTTTARAAGPDARGRMTPQPPPQEQDEKPRAVRPEPAHERTAAAACSCWFCRNGGFVVPLKGWGE